MTFTGSYTNPTVVQIPSQIQYPADGFNRVRWGEDVPFEFPDPLVDGDYRLVISENCTETPILTQNKTRAGVEDPFTFTILGGEAKELLPPGIYFFSLLRIGTTLPTTGFVNLMSGSFHVVEVPGSLEIPEEPPGP